MKKVLISVVIIFLFGLVLFFFIASGSNVSKSAYYQVKRYVPEPSSDVPDTLTVMTYNIGYLSGMTNNLPMHREYDLFKNNLAQLLNLLNNLNPQIVGLQEVDFGAARSFDQNQLDSLAMKSGYEYSYRSINWDKRYVPFPYWPIKKQFGKIISGQAVLSQFPITSDSTIKLIKPVNSSFLYDTFYLDRLVQVCDVQVGNASVKVINLHLEAFDEKTRELQAYVVKDLFEKFAEKMPVLMIGDFNSRPVNESVSQKAMKVIMKARYLASAINDSTYQASPETYYTFSSGEPYQMIDYILYNPNYIEMVESRVVNEAGEISDHLPLLMKFILKTEIGKN